MKKRKVTALVMATMMILSMTACGNSTSSASENSAASGASTGSNVSDAAETSDFTGQSLVIGVWGGTWKEAFDEACVKPFEEKYGVTIEEEEMGDNIVAQTIAQVNQGIDGIDVTCGNGASDFGQYLGVQEA